MDRPTMEQFLEMVRLVNREMKGRKKVAVEESGFGVDKINVKSCFDEYSFLVSNFFLCPYHRSTGRALFLT
jgi:hypothetical protein